MHTDKILSYCPECGGPRFQSGPFKPWRCPDCGLEFYQNTAAAAGALIRDEQNRLLFIRRAKDPSRGKLGIPGGFVDAHESAEQALIREVMEEVNLEISRWSYLCSCPNSYRYKGLTYETLDFYFVAEVTTLIGIAACDEALALEWHLPETLDLGELAFPSTVKAVTFYLNHPEIHGRTG
jgi:mutator protein MutT